MNKKQERQAVYDKTGGRCYYCGRLLKDRWHMDHVKPVVRNPGSGEMEKLSNDEFYNKVPACPRCNQWKASMSVESFRGMLENLITVLNRDSSQYRMAKDFGLVRETGRKVMFHYESGQSPEHDGLLKHLSPGEVKTLGNALNFVKNHVLTDHTTHAERTNIKNILRKLGL